MYRYAPIVLLLVFGLFAGCGDLPNIPTIDQIKTVPDSSQVTVLPQEQFTPKEGPIGTVLTVNGKGKLFPAGIAHFTFSGTGGVEFDVPEATSVIKVRVPVGTVSGPFGFTISARTSITLENALPSTEMFDAYRFEAPGFQVTDATTSTDS